VLLTWILLPWVYPLHHGQGHHRPERIAVRQHRRAAVLQWYRRIDLGPLGYRLSASRVVLSNTCAKTRHGGYTPTIMGMSSRYRCAEPPQAMGAGMHTAQTVAAGQCQNSPKFQAVRGECSFLHTGVSSTRWELPLMNWTHPT
jgi:hypothetical protein